MSGFITAFRLSKAEVASANPPGTIPLIDHELVRTQTGGHEVRQDHLHLQPEPSPDPADPLNFSMFRKITILALMALYAFITNVASSIISSALPDLVTAWLVIGPHGPVIGPHGPEGLVGFSSLTHLIAVNNLMLGAGNIILVPLSNIFGRRPIILLAMLMLFVFSIWCAEAKSFNSLLAARTLQGLGGAAADTLAPDVVGRVFFLHQRGRALAVYTACLVTGSLVGGLVGGYVSSAEGWRWTMWISAILAGALLLFSIFLLPETLFDREHAMVLARGDNKYSLNESTGDKTEMAHVEQVDSRVYSPYTFGRSLGFVKPRSGALQQFVRPWLTLRLPGTWMVMLQYAGLVALIVSVSTVAPTLLASPPYLWGANAGLINVGAIIGALLGSVYTYLAADWLVKRSAKRETNGYVEPERRLPLIFPGLIVATLGPLVFGLCAQAKTPKAWVGMEVGYGMIAFGLMIAPSIGFTYIIEAYGNLASDCFLMVVTLRAAVGFAWTFFVGTWIDKSGVAQPFGIFTLLMGLFSLTSIPVWLYGKRLRIATSPWVEKHMMFR